MPTDYKIENGELIPIDPEKVIEGHPFIQFFKRMRDNPHYNYTKSLSAYIIGCICIEQTMALLNHHGEAELEELLDNIMHLYSSPIDIFQRGKTARDLSPLQFELCLPDKEKAAIDRIIAFLERLIREHPEVSLIRKTEDEQKKAPPGKVPDYGREVNLQLFAVAAQRTIDQTELDDAELLKIRASRLEQFLFPVDKVNTRIWALLEKDTNSQIAFAAEASGDKRELNILYSVDFGALVDPTVAKRLTRYDGRVYSALGNLFAKGHGYVTLTQLHYALGNTNRPSPAQMQRMSEAIMKMAVTRISLDNSTEAEAYDYPKFVYEGTLLPMERVTIISNGNLTEQAIHLFREPPVFTFAKERGQITTLDIKVLQSPFNKTEDNLAIEDYLLLRISKAKTGNLSGTILLETLYEETGITGRMQKSRAPKKIAGYLEHFKKTGFIKGYTMTPDKIHLSVDREPRQKRLPKADKE